MYPILDVQSSIRQDGDTNLRLACLIQGRSGLFRYERFPRGTNLGQDRFEIFVKVDALRIGKYLRACACTTSRALTGRIVEADGT